MSPGRAGGPDRVILWSDGAVEWIELKKPKGRFRALQPIFHALLKTYRQRVETLYTKEAVEAYVFENKHALNHLLPKELC